MGMRRCGTMAADRSMNVGVFLIFVGVALTAVIHPTLQFVGGQIRSSHLENSKQVLIARRAFFSNPFAAPEEPEPIPEPEPDYTEISIMVGLIIGAIAAFLMVASQGVDTSAPKTSQAFEEARAAPPVAAALDFSSSLATSIGQAKSLVTDQMSCVEPAVPLAAVPQQQESAKSWNPFGGQPEAPITAALSAVKEHPLAGVSQSSPIAKLRRVVCGTNYTEEQMIQQAAVIEPAARPVSQPEWWQGMMGQSEQQPVQRLAAQGVPVESADVNGFESANDPMLAAQFFVPCALVAGAVALSKRNQPEESALENVRFSRNPSVGGVKGNRVVEVDEDVRVREVKSSGSERAPI